MQRYTKFVKIPKKWEDFFVLPFFLYVLNSFNKRLMFFLFFIFPPIYNILRWFKIENHWVTSKRFPDFFLYVFKPHDQLNLLMSLFFRIFFSELYIIFCNVKFLTTCFFNLCKNILHVGFLVFL